MLCDLLTDTGVAGQPNSFFRRESFSEWADDFSVSTENWVNRHEFDRAYLSAVLDYGTNGTPVFGMRLMWESLSGLSKRLHVFYPNLPSDSARFRAAFGGLRYLYLVREDKVAQAVSQLKAEQTGLWHVFADGAERERMKPGQVPVYDFRQLSKYVAESKQDDAAWQRWFAHQNIEPMRLTYEALASEPQAVLGTVLSSLGLDPAIAGTIAPKTAKLADRESREWIARFRAEAANYQSTS